MKKFIVALAIFLAGFSNVQAAQIDTANYLDLDGIFYPVVIVDDANAAAKINSEIRAEVKRFVETIDKQAQENNFEVADIEVDYEIPCNHDGGILSVILTEYVNFEKAAHPSTFRRALNFNSDTGERITADSLSEIAKHETDYTPQEVTVKLKSYAKQTGIVLFEEFVQLEKVPEDFYFDDDLNVHFIFQQYEVAPYAAGIIDLNAN